MERSYIRTSSKTSPSKAKEKTLQYQREGTFFIRGKQFVYRHYVELMLRMNAEERERAKIPRDRAIVYREKYEQIAREMLRPRCNLIVLRAAPVGRLYVAANTYSLIWNDGKLDTKMYYSPVTGEQVEIPINAEKLASLVAQLNLRPEKIVWQPWEYSHLLIHLLSSENLAAITTVTGHSFPNTNYDNVARVMREETEADLQEEATPESKRSTYSSAARVPTPPVPVLSGDQVEIDVPDDGNCLFWAAALGLLLPTLGDKTTFNSMYNRLFGTSGVIAFETEKKGTKDEVIEINSESTKDGVYNILISYDCQKDTPLQFQGQILEKLICELFRDRVVDKMNECFDLGRQQAIYSDAGRPNWKNYTDYMRLAGSWGGDAEIQAISQLAQTNIAISGGAVVNRYDFAGATQSLSLIHTNAAGAKGGAKNHYHFRLDKTVYTQHMRNLSGRPNGLAPLSLHTKIEAQGKAAYQEGLKLAQKEEFKQAVFQYEEAVKCVPENVEYREALADTQFRLKDFVSALENYTVILKHAPEKGTPAFLYKVGNTLSRLDRLEEAIAKYEEALMIKPLDQRGIFGLEWIRARLRKQAKPLLDDKKQPIEEKLDYKKLSSLSERLYEYIEKSDIADLQDLLLNIKNPQQKEALLRGIAKPAESLASPANEAALVALKISSHAGRSKTIAVVKFLVKSGALLDASLKEKMQKMAEENGFKTGDFLLEGKSSLVRYPSRPFALGMVSGVGYFSRFGAADDAAPLAGSPQPGVSNTDKPDSLSVVNPDDDWGDPNVNDAAFN